MTTGRMKTIGVLGGLGPQATMDLEARVHRVAQGLLPPKFNSGYPPMVVLYVRHPAPLMDESGKPLQPLRPDPRLLQAAKGLGLVADFLIIASNSVHVFVKEIEEASGRKVLSMIDLALEEVRRRGWRRIGVLGYGDPVVYTAPLGRLGIPFEIAPPEMRDALDRAIVRLIEGRDDAASAAAARAAVEELRAKRADGIILGCTEIPLLLRHDAAAEADDLLNPAALLAEAAVRTAIE